MLLLILYVRWAVVRQSDAMQMVHNEVIGRREIVHVVKITMKCLKLLLECTTHTHTASQVQRATTHPNTCVCVCVFGCLFECRQQLRCEKLLELVGWMTWVERWKNNNLFYVQTAGTLRERERETSRKEKKRATEKMEEVEMMMNIRDRKSCEGNGKNSTWRRLLLLLLRSSNSSAVYSGSSRSSDTPKSRLIYERKLSSIILIFSIRH